MYEGERWYDPRIMQFNQPDTIVQDPFDPRAYNRFSYAFYNATTYTDPTGHITEKEAAKAERILIRLANWGVMIGVDWGFHGSKWEDGLWTLDELETVLQGVRDLGKAMGGQDNFKKNLGGVLIDQKDMQYGGLGEAHHVTLNANGFGTWTVVHELAHAWDAATGWQLSSGTAKAVGARFDHPIRHWLNPNDPRYWYNPGAGPPPAGIDANFNAREDFAEAVAAYVYPAQASQLATARGWPYNDPSRGYYYAHFHDTPRGQYIQALMTNGAP